MFQIFFDQCLQETEVLGRNRHISSDNAWIALKTKTLGVDVDTQTVRQTASQLK